MVRRLCLGDIHGGYIALLQCFERSNFDYEKDQLIVLGDIVDGWPDVRECFEELMKIKNLVYINGNHDMWALDYFKTWATPEIWTAQGGKATMKSFEGYIKDDYIKFLEKAKNYYLTDDNKLFVHGGINPKVAVEKHPTDNLMWDRDLLYYAKKLKTRGQEKKLSEYDEIYIGHTSTWSWSQEPAKLCNVWCMDQGGGWEGKLSIIDIDTKEFWQSDLAPDLYPEVVNARNSYL